jgi:predicted outer membrane repeat protein
MLNRGCETMRWVALLVGVEVLAIALTAAARTWYITPDGTGDAPTIQAGLDSADAGDEVVLAEGIFTGDGNRDISFLGKAITVRSESDDPSLSIIDCKGFALESHRGFAFEHEDGPDATLRGITITEGNWDEGDGNGGAILCRGGSPNLTNLVIRGNRAKVRGGGVACADGASPALTNVRVIDNVSDISGGGLHWTQGCLPFLTDVVFENNSAVYAGGGVCGEDYLDMVISDCWFTGNTAGYGGAAAFCCSDFMLEDCHFEGNSVRSESVQDGGGALILFAGATNISRCEFDGNSSNTRGGAITVYDSRVTIQSCVFAANACVGQGGSIYCEGSDSDCSIHNCTFARNLTTDPEGAASGVGCEWWSRLSMVNSIVAYSPNGVAVSCDLDSQVELTCCNIFGNAGGDWVGSIADQLGLNGNFSACPSFCHGEMGDFHLCDESPCLPGNHPDGFDCGVIGAWGAGCSCGPSQAEPSTWGSIKSMYR